MNSAAGGISRHCSAIPPLYKFGSQPCKTCPADLNTRRIAQFTSASLDFELPANLEGYDGTFYVATVTPPEAGELVAKMTDERLQFTEGGDLRSCAV